ncbi:MAG: cytochrome P450 [Acetobacteraceae bacterium]
MTTKGDGAAPADPPVRSRRRSGQSALRRDADLWAKFLKAWTLGSLRVQPPLPPGPLGPRSISRFGDHNFFRRRWQRFGPIFKYIFSRRLTIGVGGFQRARQLFREHGEALSPATVNISAFVPHGHLRSMTSPHHEQYRSQFNLALHGDVITAWDATLRAIALDELTRLADATARGTPPKELMVPTLDRITLRWLLLLSYGLRPDDGTFRSLEAAHMKMGPSGFVYPLGPPQHEAFAELRSLVTQIAASIRTAGRSDAGDSALRRLPTASLEPEVDPTIVGNLIFMVEMGRYDLRGLLRWILKYLSDHPAVVTELRRLRDAGGGLQDYARACVQETLRLDQASGLLRNVVKDFTFEGYRFPAGSLVRVLTWESHRDATSFQNPDEYRPDRFVQPAHDPDNYAPFGIGEHRCIAAQMVVRLSTLFIEVLINNFTWRVVGDGPRFYGKFHWEPSLDFAIELHPRAAADLPVGEALPS